MPTIHLRIRGKVQGVYYRASAREQALALGLTGWVRNTPGGDVELTATGTAEALERLVEWCRKGPRNAVVTEVERTELSEEDFKGFEVRRGS